MIRFKSAVAALREAWARLRARLEILGADIRWLWAEACSDARAAASALRADAGRCATWLRRRGPRLGVPTVLANAMLLIVWLCAPHQVLLIPYKLGAVFLAGWNGYWFHRTVVPYFQPSSLLKKPWRDDLGFKEGKSDFELVEGMERLFIHATWQRAAYTLVPMLAVAWAM